MNIPKKSFDKFDMIELEKVKNSKSSNELREILHEMNSPEFRKIYRIALSAIDSYSDNKKK